MKKLVALTLLVLSPLTFAETVTPELLVGTWECKSDNFERNDLKAKWIDTLTFYQGGYYQHKSNDTVEILSKDNDKLTTHITSIGVWSIKDNILATQKRQNLSFRSDKPAIVKKYGIQQKSALYNIVVLRHIQPVSHDKLILTATDDFKKQTHIVSNGVETCQRIQ